MITAPNGIDTSAVGRIVTLAMNQNCSTSSRDWNGRLNVSRITLAASANRLPVCRSAPAPKNLASRLASGSAAAGCGVVSAGRCTVICLPPSRALRMVVPEARKRAEWEAGPRSRG